MKKMYAFLILLLVSGGLFAQIPAGYYDAAAGKSGTQLKATLNDIIDNHTEYSYSALWDILKVTDRDPNNPNNIIGIHSGFSMNAAAEYANGAGWNREHVWAKSRGDFGTSAGPGTDLHHIRAEDVSTNSARGNLPFDESGQSYTDNSGNYQGATGCYVDSDSWEPRAAVKGDVARMILYMAVRYEGENGEPDLELTEQILGNTDKQPLHGKLSTLLAWHAADPVSSIEMNRNNAIYSYQNNRNPFIDHQEYVNLIWGGGTPPPPTSGTNITIVLKTDNYPQETAWTIKNSSGTTVTSGGNYTTSNNTYTKTVSLEDGTFTFNITDAYGDGICCSYGSGFYEVKNGSSILISGGQFGSSESKNFTIGSGSGGGGTPTLPTGYCSSKGNNSSYEYISNVTIGNINSSSGNDGGYRNFSSPTGSFSIGQNISFSLSPGFSSGSYSEYFRIWIDLNRDGDYNDSQENVYTSGSTTSTVYGSFTIPSSASEGPTKMRVSMKYNGVPTACEAFSYGEVEDYTVNIGGSSARISENVMVENASEDLNSKVVNIYPNPASGLVTIIQRMKNDTEAEVSIVNINGAVVYQRRLEVVHETLNFKTDVSGLESGIYIIKITGDSGYAEMHKLVVQH